MLDPIIPSQDSGCIKGVPASLSSKCLDTLSKNSRQLSFDCLSYVSSSVLQKLWRSIIDAQRDTLELWLLFLSLAPLAIQAVTPHFVCKVDCEVFKHMPRYLKELMHAKPDLPIMQSANLESCLTFDSRLMFHLTSLANLVYLDLRSCVWPLDIDEINKVIKILIRSMQVGTLTALKSLRLPRVGPKYLKQALKISWPRTLSYLQSPIKPADFSVAWRPCSISRLDKAEVASPLIKIDVGTHNPKKPRFTKGAMERVVRTGPQSHKF